MPVAGKRIKQRAPRPQIQRQRSATERQAGGNAHAAAAPGKLEQPKRRAEEQKVVAEAGTAASVTIADTKARVTPPS